MGNTMTGSPPTDREVLRPLPAPLRWAHIFLDGVANLFMLVVEICVVAMLLINAANLFLRNIGAAGLLWVWPWTGVLMVWSVFLTFYVMYRRNMDVSLRFFIARFSQRSQRYLGLLTSLAGLVFSGVITLETRQILMRQVGPIELVGLDRYVLSIPLILSSFFLVFHFILHAIEILGRYEPGAQVPGEGIH